MKISPEVPREDLLNENLHETASGPKKKEKKEKRKHDGENHDEKCLILP